MADTKFKRDDFNMLYDYLWRDRSIAESTINPVSPLYGKNKGILAVCGAAGAAGADRQRFQRTANIYRGYCRYVFCTYGFNRLRR